MKKIDRIVSEIRAMDDEQLRAWIPFNLVCPFQDEVCPDEGSCSECLEREEEE